LRPFHKRAENSIFDSWRLACLGNGSLRFHRRLSHGTTKYVRNAKVHVTLYFVTVHIERGIARLCMSFYSRDFVLVFPKYATPWQSHQHNLQISYFVNEFSDAEVNNYWLFRGICHFTQFSREYISNWESHRRFAFYKITGSWRGVLRSQPRSNYQLYYR
jgi:hypothetical protein